MTTTTNDSDFYDINKIDTNKSETETLKESKDITKPIKAEQTDQVKIEYLDNQVEVGYNDDSFTKWLNQPIKKLKVDENNHITTSPWKPQPSDWLNPPEPITKPSNNISNVYEPVFIPSRKEVVATECWKSKRSIRCLDNIFLVKNAIFDATNEEELANAFDLLDELLEDIGVLEKEIIYNLDFHAHVNEVLSMLDDIKFNNKYSSVKLAFYERYSEKKLEELEKRLKDCKVAVWTQITKSKKQRKNIRNKLQKLNSLYEGLDD
jgi:hypothetical protein